MGQVNTNPSSLVLENLVPVSLATISKKVANASSKGKSTTRRRKVDQNQLALHKKAQRRGREEAQEEKEKPKLKQLQEQHDYSKEEAQAFLNGFESYAGFKKRRQNELLKAYDEHKLKKQKSLKIPAAANEQPAYSFDESSETSETSDQVTPSSDEDEVANRLIAATTLLNGFRSLK
jgi:hypothetical protein